MKLKHDWLALCHEFLELPDTSTAKRKAFCDVKKLNDNTFRRELTKYKKKLAAGEIEPPAKPVPEKKKPKRKSARKKAAEKEREEATHKPVGKGARKNQGAETHATVTGEGNKCNTTATNFYDENGRRRFRLKHQAGLVHGGYSKRLFGDEEQIKAYATSNIGDTLAMLGARMGSMQETAQRRKQGIIEAYNEGFVSYREVLNPETGETEPFPLSLEEALAEADMTGADVFEKIAGRFITGYEKMHKLEHADHEMPVLSTREKAELIKDIFTQRKEQDLSATDTCYLFYANGAEPPPLLLKEAELEMRNAEPEIDDNAGGVTEEEMQAAREKALQQRANTEQEIAKITKRNERLLSKVKGVGDVTVTERKEGDT